MCRPLLSSVLVLVALASSASAQDGFLEDGGGIRTERLVGTPYGPAVIDVPALGKNQPFLENGGGIRFAPGLPRYGTVSTPRSGGRSMTSSSVVEVPEAVTQGSVSGGVSAVVLGAPDTPREARLSAHAYGGPKIIRIAAARLDRRPFDASGIDVVRTGAAKIIRIAPRRVSALPEAEQPDGVTDETLQLEDGSDLASLPASPPVSRDMARAETPRNGTVSRNGTVAEVLSDDAGASTTVVQGDAPEPWTEAWRADCVRRYPDFDASLGTYRDATGRRHFCVGTR